MTLYFADLVSGAAAHVYIPVRRNGGMLAELAIAYPHVTVIDLGAGAVVPGIIRLLAIPGPRMVITQQTFGRHPLLLMLLAFATAQTSKGGSLCAYDDGGLVTRLATERWSFDTSSTFPAEMCRLARRAGYMGECGTPKLLLPNTPQSEEVPTEPFLVFHLRAFTPARTPSVGQWREFVRAARAAFPGYRFVFTGTDADTAYVDAVIEGTVNCEVRTGTHSLIEVAQVIRRACAYIGPDTGITHLAAFLGTPTVVIGTRSTPCWWATYSPSVTWLTEPARCLCTGIKSDRCRMVIEGEARFRCMADISVEAYLRALRATLSHAR